MDQLDLDVLRLIIKIVNKNNVIFHGLHPKKKELTPKNYKLSGLKQFRKHKFLDYLLVVFDRQAFY